MATSARLTKLTTMRDNLESILDSGVDEYEIRGRRVNRASIVDRLEYVNKQIEICERQQASPRGRARNQAVYSSGCVTGPTKYA